LARVRERSCGDQLDDLIRKAETGGQWAEICRLEAKGEEARTAEGDAEAEVFKTVPETPAGALMLLRSIADYIDEHGVNDDWNGNLVGEAIRNAAATLESGRPV
jgi:hypothetical protein